MVAKGRQAFQTMVRTDRNAGFTLLEVLAVLAIATLVLGLALPRIGMRASPAATEAIALRLIAALDHVRYTARRTNATLTSTIDVQNNLIKMPPQDVAFRLPDTVKLTTRAAPPCEPSGRRIIFYADGRSCAPILILTSATTSLAVRINPLTGAISLGP